MSASGRWHAAIILGLGLALGACAGARTKPDVAATPEPAPAPPLHPAPQPPAPPPPPIPSARELLAARHKEKARLLERDGQLRQARDEWKIALTIQPNDGGAGEALKALEARIERAVSERIQQGRGALARGVHVEARRQFLSALALDPRNRAAFDALQNEVRAVEFITHTVRPGETLQSLAQRYYGDSSRSEVIWETNQLPPNPRLVAGRTLRIPEIPGVPFVRPEARREVPRESPARPEASPPAPPRSDEPVREAPPEVNPLLLDAREAFDRAEYAVALADLDKLLTSSPGNREGIDLKKAVLYWQGKSHLDQRNYQASYQALTMLAKLQPDYEDTTMLLQRARGQLVTRHYSEGLRLYREEKLREAIVEWRTVLQYEPKHANARRNIEQAERLLKGLEERKKRQ